MFKIEVLNLSISRIVMRFYLMMAVVLIGGYTGMWWLAAFGLPIFLSALLGIRFKGNRRIKQTQAKRMDTQVGNLGHA